MKMIFALALTFIATFNVHASKCAPLKNYLDLALNRGHSITRAGEIEQRLHTISQASDVRVRNGNGEYVLARDISYEDGNIIFKIGDEVQPPYQIGDDFNDVFRLASEVPTPAPSVLAEAPASPNITTTDFRSTDLDIAEGRVADAAIPRGAPESPRPASGETLPAVIPNNPNAVVPQGAFEAPSAPRFEAPDATVAGRFDEVTDVRVRPEDVTYGRPEQRRPSNPDNLPAVIPQSPGTAVTEVTTVAPAAPNGGVAPSTGTDIIPAPSMALTRVERPDVPQAPRQIEGPSRLLQIEGPEPRPLLEGPTPRPALEAPEQRLALPGPDDGLRGGPAPRYAPDVVRPTSTNFSGLEGEVIRFTSPRGNNTTVGEVVRVNDASVVVRLENGTEVRKPFVDISAESIENIRPRPTAFIPRATAANFPDELIGDVVTFTTPAGQRTSTGRVVRVFDRSVVIELPDGTLVNERFRNINAASVQQRRPIPAPFIERPTRLDFPDTLIGRSVTFTTPAGQNTTTGIVQAPINGQSVNVLLPDGTIVNKRFRDMSRASVRETPVPAVIPEGNRALVAAGDAAEAGTEVTTTRGVELTLSAGDNGRDVARTGTELEPRPLTGEILDPERPVVTRDPVAGELESPVIDGVPYTVVDEVGDAGRRLSDTVRAIPARAETMPPQGFLDTFGDVNIILNRADGTPEIGRITRVDGESIIFTNLDGASRSIRAADLDPRQMFRGELDTVIRNQDNLVFSRPDGEAWLGPFGAVDEAGRAIPDDEILDLLNSGSRLRRAANGMLEFVGQGGRRFFISARNLADRGITMLNRAGDFVLNFPRTLRALTALGTGGRIARLAPSLRGLLEDDFTAETSDDDPALGPDGDPAPDADPSPEADPDPEADPEPETPANPNDFPQDPPGTRDDPPGNDEGGETEQRVPIPPAPRGNPVGPPPPQMQKLNIIRTNGVM